MFPTSLSQQQLEVEWIGNVSRATLPLPLGTAHERCIRNCCPHTPATVSLRRESTDGGATSILWKRQFMKFPCSMPLLVPDWPPASDQERKPCVRPPLANCPAASPKYVRRSVPSMHVNAWPFHLDHKPVAGDCGIAERDDLKVLFIIRALEVLSVGRRADAASAASVGIPSHPAC